MLNNRVLAWSAPVVWMAVIFILSHQPASVSSDLSSGVTRIILELITSIFQGQDAQVENFHTLVRKNAHFIAYLILGVLLVNAIKNKRRLDLKIFAASFAVAVLYAATDEFHQLFIEGRSGEFWDVLIDSAGAATGLFIYWAVNFFAHKINAKSH